LEDEGYDVAMPPVGVMIEVPAAVYQADALARRVVLSIGTNDLTQYLLAVDRNNAHVASLYDDLHPAVLRALISVVAGARVYGREVSVCGEMAGDPLAAPTAARHRRGPSEHGRRQSAARQGRDPQY
jgi:phosphotransferase system enzyme I (PtsP)